MRMLLGVALISLCGCSLIGTRRPDPPPWKDRPECNDAYGRPVLDLMIGMTATAAAVVGAAAVIPDPTVTATTRNTNAAIGVALLAGGIIASAFFPTSAGIGFRNVTECRAADSEWTVARSKAKAALISARRADTTEMVDGFREVPWGSTVDQTKDMVRDLEHVRLPATAKETWGVKGAVVAGLHATVLFVFDEGRLRSGQVVFDENQTGYIDNIAVCRAVRGGMTSRYGEGTQAGNSVMWRGSVTAVALVCDTPIEHRTVLEYFDRAFMERTKPIDATDL